jgi:hypothetical protein
MDCLGPHANLALVCIVTKKRVVAGTIRSVGIIGAFAHALLVTCCKYAATVSN